RAEHGADFPVANHYFRSGKADSLVNVSGAAILASSKNKELAEKLLAHLLGETAQTFFAEVNHEFPVVAGIKTPLDLPELDALNAPDVDITRLEDLATTHKILRDARALPGSLGIHRPRDLSVPRPIQRLDARVVRDVLDE